MLISSVMAASKHKFALSVDRQFFEFVQYCRSNFCRQTLSFNQRRRMISHERKTVTLDWQIQSHSLGHRNTKVSHGIMNHDFSCCSLDGMHKGVKRKVCPKSRYHKMACSMVYSKSLLMNVYKTWFIELPCLKENA